MEVNLLCQHLQADAYGADATAVGIADVITDYANHLLPYAACAAVATIINIAILPFAQKQTGV